MICSECGRERPGPSNLEKATGLCECCAMSVPGAMSSCPNCDSGYVSRVEGLFGEWEWHLNLAGVVILEEYENGIVVFTPKPIRYCPAEGCDLEIEFHHRLRAEKARHQS